MQVHASIKKLKTVLSAIKQLENCLQPRITTNQFSGVGYETADSKRTVKTLRSTVQITTNLFWYVALVQNYSRF